MLFILISSPLRTWVSKAREIVTFFLHSSNRRYPVDRDNLFQVGVRLGLTPELSLTLDNVQTFVSCSSFVAAAVVAVMFWLQIHMPFLCAYYVPSTATAGCVWPETWRPVLWMASGGRGDPTARVPEPVVGESGAQPGSVTGLSTSSYSL